MTTRKTRFIRGNALLHEDRVTPMHHHHDDAQDTFRVDVDGTTRSMSPCEADGYVTERYDNPELTDVEHEADGPRGVRRRHVLMGAGAGFGALLTSTAMPRYAFAAPGGGQHLLVCVFMRGGFDGLSAVVPVGDKSYYAARPTIGVREGNTFALDGTWAMNSNMSALAPLWRSGDLAVVQGSGSPEVGRSHFQDQASVERAAPANVRSGWLGRHMQTSSAKTGTFRGITIGNSTVLSLTTTAMETVAMSSIDAFDLRTYNTQTVGAGVRRALDQMYRSGGGRAQAQADSTFAAIDTLRGLRQSPSLKASSVKYPDSAFGRGLSEIARLARSGVGMEAACIDIDDWDMHYGLGKASDAQSWFARRSRDFAEGLAAFRTDMGERWASTTVVTMSEFGRRVAENGSGGLDHGQGNTMFVLGGGVKGGRVYGAVPTLAQGNLTSGDVPISLDYRQALSEIVTTRLGNGANLGQVFPGFTPGAKLGIV